MTSPSQKSPPGNLEVGETQPIASMLLSYGQSIVDGLTEGGQVPTIWEMCRQLPGDNSLGATDDSKAEDLPDDWKLYLQNQFYAPAKPEAFHHRVVAQLRRIFWDRLNVSCPRIFWPRLGEAAWSTPGFRVKYCEAIQEILRIDYIRTADDRQEVPLLSPQCFWLLLSLTPLGAGDPRKPVHKESTVDVSAAVYNYTPYPYFGLELIWSEEEHLAPDFSEYLAVSDIQSIAKSLASNGRWANFWDQLFLIEIYKKRDRLPGLDYDVLHRHLKGFPLFGAKDNDNEGSTLKAPDGDSLSCPQILMPSWYIPY
jgi:hypothetical protein